MTFDSTGMGVLRAYLPAADAALLKAVLSQLSKPDPQTVCTVENEDGSTQEEVVRDQRSLAVRQYDAWMTLVRRGLLRFASAPSGDTVEAPTSSAQPEVKLVITATAEQAAGLRGSGKATFDRVGPVDTRTLSVFTCSATLRRVLTDPRGVPIDVGRAYRLATPALRAALVARDRGCVVPGCTVPADGCDAHHVIAWSKGGPTDLANMVLVCPRHHQALHDGVYEVEIRDGIPWVRPPITVDLQQRWRRNPLHHNGSHVKRLMEQLTLAMAGESHRSPDEVVERVVAENGEAA